MNSHPRAQFSTPSRAPSRRPQGFILAHLSPSRRALLFQWLAWDNLTYPQANERVRREFGLNSTPYLLSRFWQTYCTPRLLRMANPSIPLKPQNAPGCPRTVWGVCKPRPARINRFSVGVGVISTASGKRSKPAFGGKRP